MHSAHFDAPPFRRRSIYFVCSELNRPVSVLRRPPGTVFSLSSVLGQTGCLFGNGIDRADIGRAKLKAKLCSPNLDNWRIPPKPPNMRSATYDRLIKQYLRYDAALGGAPIQQISKRGDANSPRRGSPTRYRGKRSEASSRRQENHAATGARPPRRHSRP